MTETKGDGADEPAQDRWVEENDELQSSPKGCWLWAASRAMLILVTSGFTLPLLGLSLGLLFLPQIIEVYVAGNPARFEELREGFDELNSQVPPAPGRLPARGVTPQELGKRMRILAFARIPFEAYLTGPLLQIRMATYLRFVALAGLLIVFVAFVAHRTWARPLLAAVAALMIAATLWESIAIKIELAPCLVALAQDLDISSAELSDQLREGSGNIFSGLSSVALPAEDVTFGARVYFLLASGVWQIIFLMSFLAPKRS